ncbi:MAG: hypothetical protein Q9177_001332 [Variospora cf. flavescens]
MHIAILAATALTGFAVVNAAGPTGRLGDAAIFQDNPVGVTYTATLPNRETTDVRGFVTGTSNANGTGVNFIVNLSGFPDSSLGPFSHQDSYIRGEVPPCDPTQPQTCQDGDLAGKHGNITTSSFQTAYLDLYLSTAQGPGSFFGNRSIVIHTSNTTRLTCANFTLTSGNNTNGTVTGSNPVPSPFTGGAAVTYVGSGAILAGLAALLL